MFCFEATELLPYRFALSKIKLKTNKTETKLPLLWITSPCLLDTYKVPYRQGEAVWSLSNHLAHHCAYNDHFMGTPCSAPCWSAINMSRERWVPVNFEQHVIFKRGEEDRSAPALSFTLPLWQEYASVQSPS